MHWPRVRLGDVLKSVSRSEPVEPTREYRILGAHWYAKGLYTKETKSGEHIRASKLFRVEMGDFVYNRLFAWKGSFAVATKSNAGCYVSGEFLCYQIDARKLLADYLLCHFSIPHVWNEALGLSSGSTPTSRNRLKEDKFLRMEIPLPPIDEQRRLVLKMSFVSDKVAEANQLRKLAAEDTEALFEQERARVFAAAESESCVPLGSIVALERGRFSHRPRNDPRFFGGRHPWIQITEIGQSDKFIRKWSDTLNDDGLAVSKKFRKGTVLVSIAATIGSAGILNFDCCAPDSIVGATPRDGVDSEFLYYYFGYIRSHLESVAPKSAQKNVNLQILSRLPAPNLKPERQRRIVAYLDSLEERAVLLRKLRFEMGVTLDRLSNSLLCMMFEEPWKENA